MGTWAAQDPDAYTLQQYSSAIALVMSAPFGRSTGPPVEPDKQSTYVDVLQHRVTKPPHRKALVGNANASAPVKGRARASVTRIDHPAGLAPRR